MASGVAEASVPSGNFNDVMRRACCVMCVAGRWGGAITAALFLQEFIDKDTQWCHLDVAGPAWNDATSLPTGFGAATLAQWVDSLAQQQQQPAAQS